MGLRNVASGSSSRLELATFTLVFEKPDNARFTPDERLRCAEEGRKSLLKALQALNKEPTIKIELVEVGGGAGSYWIEYIAYVVGFIGLAGGVGNAIHLVAEGLIQTGNLVNTLGTSMTAAGSWLKRIAWRFNAQSVNPELAERRPGCFGMREHLDRRTKRCKGCGFLTSCVAEIEGN